MKDNVQVHLGFSETATQLEICDDGVGFDPAAARLGGGFGISSMSERVARIQGTIKIVSAPGRGTQVTVHAPLPLPQAGEKR